MDNNKLKMAVTAGAIIVGCLVVALWLLLPFPFSPRTQAPVTSEEFFLIKVETEMDSMRMLLALRNKMGFIEAQDPAERIRDLCFNVDKEGWKRWSEIVDDMNSWYKRLVIQGTASLEEVLGELYTKYPFLNLEGAESQEYLGDMIIKTPVLGSNWNTSSAEWSNIPGLLIKKMIDKGNVFVVFEGDMEIVSPKTGIHTGSIRLLVNDEERGIKELSMTVSSTGISKSGSLILKWKGELAPGEHIIKVQAKVSDSDTSLKPAKGDVPKLVLIK
ncbi:MAG: hypothetical protein WCV56_06735 [Candidatus Omnitrophota bacterium]